MTPAETAIRAALEAGPTPGPWEWYSPNHLEGKGDTVLAANDDGKPYGRHSALIEHHWDAAQAKANQMLIAACNPAALAELLAELTRLRAENEALRDLLAVRVAGALLYVDDGELQDNTQHPCIDFRRDSPEDIRRKLHERRLANYRRSLAEDVAIDAAKGGANG